MPTVKQIRRSNLLLLEEAFPTFQALADAVGKSHSQLSQIKGGYSHSTTGAERGMGDKVARDITTALCVPEGWLDAPRTPDEVARVADRTLASRAVKKSGEAKRAAPIEEPDHPGLILAQAFARLPKVFRDGGTRAEFLRDLLVWIQARDHGGRPTLSWPALQDGAIEELELSTERQLETGRDRS